MGCNCHKAAPVAQATPVVAPKPRSGMVKVLHGAKGLAKAALQTAGVPIDQASPECVRHRRDVCRACPESTKDPAYLDHPCKGLTMFSRCKLCTCVISAKTLQASEYCEAGKW